MTRSLALVVAGGLALQACAKPAATPADTTADRQTIDQLNDREIAIFSNGLLDSLSAVFADDVIALPPNEPAVNGVAALRKWAEGMYQQFSVAGSYDSKETMVMGDWAVTRYTGRLSLTPKAGGAVVQDRLKGVHVLHRGADGRWKITQDIWNTDTPPAPPAAPPKVLPDQNYD